MSNEIGRLKEERDELRRICIATVNATDGACGDTVSTEFLAGLPQEVRAMRDSLRKRRDELLEANNREVERRRAAEKLCNQLQAQLSLYRRAAYETGAQLTALQGKSAAAVTTLDSERAANAKLTQELDLTTRVLLNLLAVIHRDGGQYVEAHGLAKAAADAESKVVAWLARDDNDTSLLAEVRALVKAEIETHGQSALTRALMQILEADQ